MICTRCGKKATRYFGIARLEPIRFYCDPCYLAFEAEMIRAIFSPPPDDTFEERFAHYAAAVEKP